MTYNGIKVGPAELQEYFTDICKAFGVSCKIFYQKRCPFSGDKESYVVFSPHKMPETLDARYFYIRNERSNDLFYTDYYVVKLDDKSDMVTLAASAFSYCYTVDFLMRLFKEFKTPLPKVLRGDEIGGLKEFNQGRINPSLPHEGRVDFQKGLQKYFEQENTKSKYAQKWRAFSRTNQYNRHASYLKMFRDFHRRDSQIIDLDLLHETNDFVNSTLINEHEFVKFKEEIKKRYPEVLYSISKVEVQNEGFDVRRNKNKPIDKIEGGPHGKLITYQAYCEEVEKHFATEGYEALRDLVPAYYVTRQLYYKMIDEPFVADVLNRIRFAYAKSDGLGKVQIFGIDTVQINIPVGDMMNFVSLAKANNVPFYIDFSGLYETPNFDNLRVVYSSFHRDMMQSILERLIQEKFAFGRIPISMKELRKGSDRAGNLLVQG